MNDDGAWNTNVTYNNFNGCEVLRLVGITLLNKLKLFFLRCCLLLLLFPAR